MNKRPRCTAPFNSIVIETDKSVKPCCMWKDKPLGNLNNSTINEIRKSKEFRQLQQDMLSDVVIKGCENCVEREKQTGMSMRIGTYNALPFNNNDDVLFLEYCGTNTCNLACAMCNSSFSSTWVSIQDRFGYLKLTDKYPPEKIHPIDLDLTQTFLSGVDLSHLSMLWLKGGEPFMNKEIISVLEHLEVDGILKNISVSVTTNATIVNHRLLELLSKAKSVSFYISIDGIGDLNKWIRWAGKDSNLSNSENILNNIKMFCSIGNVETIKRSFAIQVYNIFNLEENQKWWEENVHPLLPQNIAKDEHFLHVLISPPHLSVRTLSRKTCDKLADKYEKLNNPAIYGPIINVLRLPYLGDEIHNTMVDYTIKMNKIRQWDITDIVPELKDELQIIKQI